MKKRNKKTMFPKTKPDGTPQGRADEMSRHVFNLLDSGLVQIATLDSENTPYIAVMMRADLWQLIGKRFVLKQGGMNPSLYTR